MPKKRRRSMKHKVRFLFAFLIFGIIQIIFIIFIANFYDWDDYNKQSASSKEENDQAKKQLEKYFKTFQDINVMIILGFGFLRTFLKHYSWSSIALTFIGGILSFEFGLFAIICWASIIRRDWYPGLINFRYLLDANYLKKTEAEEKHNDC